MSSMGGNWRATIQDNIRSSEETLRRIREQQFNHKAARRALTAAFDAPHKTVPDISASFPTASDVLEDKVNCLQSQVRNCLTELETERTVRCDSIRDTRQLITIHVGELKAMFQQLKKENEYLTDTVQLLEKRLTSNSSFALSGRANFGMDVHGASITGGPAPAAAAAVSSDIAKRVEELESSVTRQKRMMEDRQTRLDGVLREMVSVKINTEVERMRSVARDAARESVEELIRLRLTAMQQMFNDELQRVMRSTGVSSEVAQTTERLFRQMEHDVQRRLQELSSALDGVSGGVRRHESTLIDMEDRIMQKVTAMGREVETSRREMQDEMTKNTQNNTARNDAVQLAMESKVLDLVAIACQGVAKKEDIATVMADLRDRLEQQSAAMCDRLTAAKNEQGAAAAEYHKQVAELEERLDGIEEAAEKIRQQITHVTQLVTGAKTDMEQCKLRVHDAFKASEESRALAQESVTCAKKAENVSREGVARSEAELRRFAQEQAASTMQIRQLNEKITTAEAHQAVVRVAVNELSDRFTDTLPPLTAKLDSLQRTVQDVCMPRMEELMQSSRELQALCEQQQTKALSMVKTDNRQLSDIRRELSTGLQGVEDRVLQTLHEWQQETTVTMGGLKTAVDGLRGTVKTHEKLFARKDALDVIEEEITEKLVFVEGKIDTISLKLAKKEQTPAPPPVSMYTMASEVQENLERQLEELRHRVDGARQITVRQWSDMQNHVDVRMQEEVERVTQALSRMREENSSQMQKLRTLLSEEAEDRCRRVEEVVKSDTYHLQTRIEGLRETLEPNKLISAIYNDEKVLNEFTRALQAIFAPRTDTTDAITHVKKKIWQFEQRVNEIEAACETHEREVEQRVKAYDLVHRAHAERMASLESQQETMATLNKQWCDESCRERKNEMDLLSAQFDERVDAVQSVVAGVELQTRAIQFSLQELQEEQAALRKEFAESQTIQQPTVMAVHMHGDKNRGNNDEKENDDDNADVWKAHVEERIGALEVKTDATANSTADALDGLHEGIEKCVSLFVQEATSAALLKSSTAAEEMTGLDGVLLFLLNQLCDMHNTVQALHSGALGTLDLVQHHEGQLALLPSLQSLVVRFAGHIGKIAESVGLQLDVSINSLIMVHNENITENDDAMSLPAHPAVADAVP